MSDEDDEEDFSAMHQQYMALKMNRNDLARDSASIISIQQKQIDDLKKENEALKRDCRTYLRKPRGPLADDVISRLNDQQDGYVKRIHEEKRRMEEYNKQIDALKDKILNTKRSMGGINYAKESAQMVQKQVRILENRLDKSLIRFNEALAYNQKLRAQIDNLRRERVVFDGISKKLEKQLHDKEKKAADLVEQSNQCYEKRDAAQTEMAQIEQQNNLEHREFDQRIAEYDEDEERMAKEISEKYSKNNLGELTLEEEEELKKGVTKSAWQIAKDKAGIQGNLEKVQSYEEAFNKIRATTGITDIDELVNTFIAHEDQNFSLFNYVSSQANEIEKLEETIAQLREEEMKLSKDTGEDVNQHEQLRKELEVQLESTHAMAEKYEIQYQEAVKTLADTKMGIQSLFYKIGCDQNDMSEFLTENVTEANLMQYLGLIEQRCNEILQMWAIHEQGGVLNIENEEHKQALVGILGEGPEQPLNSNDSKIRIAPPSMEEYSDVEDDDDNETENMPRKLDQIKSEVLKYISQKSANRDTVRSADKPRTGKRRI